MKIFVDNMRHIVCVPYSIENLHAMAEQLGINRCWFHKTHYDAPKTMHAKLLAEYGECSPREIISIINNQQQNADCT